MRVLEENFVVDTVAWPTWRITFRFVGQVTCTEYTLTTGYSKHGHIWYNVYYSASVGRKVVCRRWIAT